MKNDLGFARLSLGVMSVLLVGTGVIFAGSGPTRYRIEDLGTFGGPGGCEEGVHPTFAAARGINESGDVVGWAERTVQLLDPDTGEPLYYPDTGHAVCRWSSHAALWSNGEIIDLGGLIEGGRGIANGLNDHGQVVGEAEVQNGFHPFLWTEENGMVDLFEDWPTQLGTSWGINNFGEITIVAYGVGGYFRAANGDLRLIRFPDAPDTEGGEAWEINDDGLVAGWAYTEDGRANAFRYDSRADVVENIHDPFYRDSYGYGVNDQGDIGVVMVAYTGHGFSSVSNADGDLTVLPLGNIREQGVLRPDLLLGGVDDVNAHGDVVGVDVSVAHLPTVGWIAFDVFGDGPIEKIDLDDLLSPEDQAEWQVHQAWAINDARQIVGRGLHNGRSRAFLMTPDDSAANGDTGSATPSLPAPGGEPVVAIRTEIDPLTGLRGVKNFVPEEMGSGRVVGSLRPRFAIERDETSTVESIAPISGANDRTLRASRRALELPNRDANTGEDLESLDRKPAADEPPRQRESRRNSTLTIRDDR